MTRGPPSFRRIAKSDPPPAPFAHRTVTVEHPIDMGRIRGTPVETRGDKMNAKRSPLASGRGGLRVESGRRTRAPRGRGRGLWRDRQPGHGEGADGGRDHLRSQRRPLYLQDGRLLTLDDPVELVNLVLAIQLTPQEKKDLVAFVRTL